MPERGWGYIRYRQLVSFILPSHMALPGSGFYLKMCGSIPSRNQPFAFGNIGRGKEAIGGFRPGKRSYPAWYRIRPSRPLAVDHREKISRPDIRRSPIIRQPPSMRKWRKWLPRGNPAAAPAGRVSRYRTVPRPERFRRYPTEYASLCRTTG